MFTITWFDLHKTFHKLCTKYSFEISYFMIPSRLFNVLWYTFLPTSFTALFLLSIRQSHPHGINCKSIRQLPAKSSGPSHDFNILKRRQRGFFQCFYFCHIAGFYAFGHKRANLHFLEACNVVHLTKKVHWTFRLAITTKSNFKSTASALLTFDTTVHYRS